MPEALRQVQQDIEWAEHLVLVFPLWLGAMPAFVYRWFYSAHTVRALERNVLAFIGIAAVCRNFFGGVDKVDPAQRERWQADMHRLGRSGR